MGSSAFDDGVTFLQKTVGKCTKILNACARPLSFSMSHLFNDVFVAVMV